MADEDIVMDAGGRDDDLPPTFCAVSVRSSAVREKLVRVNPRAG